jgi:hypothetical protein
MGAGVPEGRWRKGCTGREHNGTGKEIPETPTELSVSK